MKLEEPPTAAALAEEADALVAALAEALAAVEGGVPLEMDGLDGWVSSLCEGATSLPPAQARSLLGRLDAVVAGMDALSVALGDQQRRLMDAVAARPDAHTNRRRAASAYGNSGPQTVNIAVPAAKPPSRDER